jgi:hypothetical protein
MRETVSDPIEKERCANVYVHDRESPFVKVAVLLLGALALLNCAKGLAASADARPPDTKVVSAEAKKYRSKLDYANALKARADAGDSEAMFKLGIALLLYAPATIKAEKAGTRRWLAVGDKFKGPEWLEKSALAGYRPAIEHQCKMSKGPYATAAQRAEGGKWCGLLGE